MKKTALIFAVASACWGNITQVQAAGFQLAETSATGLGRAFAGEAVMADNAAAQFRNPALLTGLAGTQISAGGIMVMPNIDIVGQTTDEDPWTGEVIKVDSQAKDIAGNAFIPDFYFTQQLNQDWFLGLALSSGYGMSSKLDDDFRGTQFGNQASITTIELNPNIAYRLRESFSLGFGVRYVLGKGDIGAKSSDSWAYSPQSVPKGTVLKFMQGDDKAWGWQLGATWQINAGNRIGVNYRSAVDLNLHGFANGFGFNPFDANEKYTGTMFLTLPATAEIASFNQLTEKLAIYASLNWTDWSSFKKLKAVIPAVPENAWLVKEEDWHDSYRAALGTSYDLTEKTRLRAGIAFDKSAVDDATRTLTIPEMNRYWLSLGYGYRFSNHLNLDFSCAYIVAQKSHVAEPRQGALSDQVAALFGGEFSGTTQGNALLFGIQLSYQF